MSRLAIPLFAICLVFFAGYAAYVLTSPLNDDDPLWRLQPDDPQIVMRGDVLYQEHCAACHGINLEGQPNWRVRDVDGKLPAPPHDESGHTWHHADENLFELTKLGVQHFAGADYVSDMPAYDGVLTDAEIVAVLSYIKSTWPDNVRDAHDRLNGLHLEK